MRTTCVSTARGLTACLALLFAVGLPGAAQADLELFVGGAFSNGDSGDNSFADVDPDDAFIGGLRSTSWFFDYVGFSTGISVFAPDAEITVSGGASLNVDVYVIPITAQIALRLPLFTSDDKPEGWVRPYVAGGGGLFITVVDSPLGVSVNDDSYDFGPDVRVGVDIALTNFLSVFTEYRYTTFDADFELETNYIQAGLGLAFF